MMDKTIFDILNKKTAYTYTLTDATYSASITIDNDIYTASIEPGYDCIIKIEKGNEIIYNENAVHNGKYDFYDISKITLETVEGTGLNETKFTVSIHNLKGIFHEIQAKHSSDFSGLDFNELDNEFRLSYANNKAISPFMDIMFNADNYTESGNKVIGSQSLKRIAEIVWNKFGYGWKRIWMALSSTYNPIENYNSTEQESSKQQSEIISENQGTNTESYLYGFNSTDPVHDSKNSVSGTNKTTQDPTKNKTERELTRHGNIGVTTNQQMIDAEIQLRSKQTMWAVMMGDANTEMCSTYFLENITSNLLEY